MRNLRVLKSGLNAADSDPTSLYSPNEGTKALLNGILVCNTTSSDATVNIGIRPRAKAIGGSHGTIVYIARETAVPANTTIELIDGEYPLVNERSLTTYDEIIAFSTSTTAIDVYVSLLSDVN